MKRIKLRILALVIVQCCTMASTSNADVLRVPGVITVVADRVEGSAVTILDFDLPRLRQGEGCEIVSATISWDHAGLTQYKTVRYRVFDSIAQVSGSLPTLSLRTALETALVGEPSSTGVFFPQDFRRVGKGHLSFDVLAQVRRVIDLSGNHLQVLVATDDMSPEGLGAGASSVPTLVIRYGFLGEMKSTLGRAID